MMSRVPTAIPTVRRDQHRFLFDAVVPPALTVPPSSRVRVETWDCFSNTISAPHQAFARLEDLLKHTGGLNPIAGPIAIAGAEPGDLLAVHIEAIELGTAGQYAVTTVIPGVGGLCGAPAITFGPDTRICPIDGGEVHVPVGRGVVSLPVRPMIGTIGTAPSREAFDSVKYGPEHCGNVDCPDVTVGSTILLPVNVPGAMLSLGDVHAAMGDAEITGIALETSADVILRVDLIKASGSPYVRCPQIETAELVGSIGCHFGRPLEANIRAGFADMVERLRRGYGIEPVEAYQLLGAVAGVRVNQCVEGGWSSALVYVSKDILVRLARATQELPRAGATA